MSETIEITDANFQSEVLDSDKLVLVDFWAEWCGPCRMVGPIMKKLAAEYGDKVVVGKLNVDDNGESAVNYRVRNIPTVLFFKGGEVVAKQVGAVPKAGYVKLIDEQLTTA